MSTLFDKFNTGDDAGISINTASTYWQAMTFTAAYTYVISSIKIKIYRSGTPGTGTVSLYSTVGGVPSASLSSGTYDLSGITTDTGGEWIEFELDTAINIVTGNVYAIVFDDDSTAGNECFWRADNASGYSGGIYKWTGNSGTTWTDDVSERDCMFEVYGTQDPVDKTYSRQLVAIGNNEIWYESVAGTMTELTAANGDIDVVYPLSACRAFQKLFIVNKTNKKVADFINTKIATADAGAYPCSIGMTLTGGTSTATMVVDYVDGVTDDAAANIYGYRNSQVGFSSGETVTGTNSDGNTVSFATSAAETAPPHWYNWTVYGNDTTTYGTMLSEPTLICLYRGRLVISGDKDIPHAWQMTKVGNPWKVLYDFTNDGDLSGVAYSNNLVGEIGDIITALIPYKDDLLIFGCADSIWILVGDPLSSGTLAEITHHTGIWGKESWCIDNKKNLYFLGADGIYRMPISETSSPPENISKSVLPNLMSDLGLNKSIHRVVLSFDPVENGIIISKTQINSGENTNYFYSLITGGFFPETYPNSCGIFCSYYYPATNQTYKKFLIGCTDGYIREFDNSTKNDTTTSSTSAISSYLTIIQKLGTTEFAKGMLRELSSIVSGGASSGDFSDTDAVSWALYSANDAETALEDIKDGATAFTSGTWSTVGKQNKSRPRMRGIYAGIKLYNSTASQTWSLEKIYGEVIEKGKA